MKTLIFADVHLKVSSAGQRHLQDFVAFIRQIDPKEYNRVIILGDLFDQNRLRARRPPPAVAALF